MSVFFATFAILMIFVSLKTQVAMVAGAERDWNPKDVLTFKFTLESKNTTTVLSGNGSVLSSSTDVTTDEYFLNVTINDVDDSRQEANVTKTFFDSEEKGKDNTFVSSVDAETVGTNIANGLIDVLVLHDDPFNTIEISQGILGTWIYLVEPDWKNINDVIRSFWYESTVPLDASLNDRPRHYTIGDLLSNVTSYKIMGKNDLAAARDALTDNTRA